MKILAFLIIELCSTAYGQMQKQQQCSEIVKKDLASTQRDKPEVWATVKTHMFELSLPPENVSHRELL